MRVLIAWPRRDSVALLRAAIDEQREAREIGLMCAESAKSLPLPAELEQRDARRFARMLVEDATIAAHLARRARALLDAAGRLQSREKPVPTGLKISENNA